MDWTDGSTIGGDFSPLATYQNKHQIDERLIHQGRREIRIKYEQMLCSFLDRG